MKLHKCGEFALFILLVATSVLIVGCIVSDSDVRYTGVENDTLKQVLCGTTTKDWLVSTVGEPSEQSLTDEGTEILSYKCTKIQDNEFVLFPIIVIDDKKEFEHTVYFEVKDGIVQRYWKKG